MVMNHKTHTTLSALKHIAQIATIAFHLFLEMRFVQTTIVTGRVFHVTAGVAVDVTVRICKQSNQIIKKTILNESL